MEHHDFLARLARDNGSKIILLVLDGVGDLRTAEQPETALDRAVLPNFDALAGGGSLGRIVPVAPGITPGSGPGHLALFGYDPREPRFDIGRGVLEALGLGLSPGPDELAARGNFATADADGSLVDRRAGRIPTEECRRLTAAMQERVRAAAGLQVRVEPGEGHRFVLLLRGADLSDAVRDTDPQRTGVPPLPARARTPEAAATADKIDRVVEALNAVISDEPKANRVLLRGFSKMPDLPSIPELYRVRAGAFAGYPLYRGVASACGMEVVPCGKTFAEIVDVVARRWDDFDYFFLHVKQTDAAGEDGDVAAKAAVLEEVDRDLPRLLELGPDVIAVTGDHSTPAPMAAHSWHPVPLLIASKTAFVDDESEYTEAACARGTLGTFPSRQLLGVLLAHAGRLAKFGA